MSYLVVTSETVAEWKEWQEPHDPRGPITQNQTQTKKQISKQWFSFQDLWFPIKIPRDKFSTRFTEDGSSRSQHGLEDMKNLHDSSKSSVRAQMDGIGSKLSFGDIDVGDGC